MRGLNYLIHAHEPCASDPTRCAVCLSPLDCAPHLPLTPRATYPGETLDCRMSTSTRIQLRILEMYEGSRRARAAVQGER